MIFYRKNKKIKKREWKNFNSMKKEKKYLPFLLA